MAKIKLPNRFMLWGMLVPAFAFAGLLVGVLLSYKDWSAIYRSKCVLVLRDESQHNPFLRGSFPSYQYHLESAALKCKSDARIEAVIRELNLDGDIEDAIQREKLRSGIRDAVGIEIGEGAEDSRLVNIYCEWNDRVECRDIVEAFSKLFVSEAIDKMKKENLYAIECLDREVRNTMEEVVDVVSTSFEAARNRKMNHGDESPRGISGSEISDAEIKKKGTACLVH